MTQTVDLSNYDPTELLVLTPYGVELLLQALRTCWPDPCQMTLRESLIEQLRGLKQPS